MVFRRDRRRHERCRQIVGRKLYASVSRASERLVQRNTIAIDDDRGRCLLRIEEA
jgi:hypothetical protein